MFNLYNVMAYQVAWFACVLGAAHDLPWAGAAVAIIVTFAHISMSGRARADLALVIAAGSIGLLVDSALARGGYVAFESGVWADGWAPYWMVSLWAAFATTLNHSLRWVIDRPVIAILLGVVGGPLAYVAGRGLGALQSPSAGHAVPAIAAAWGAAMAVLSVIAARLRTTAVDARPPLAMPVANAVSTSTLIAALAGCQASLPPIATAPHVDLERFMGDWYVIANIPTSIERGAHNAVESYRLDDDGTIATTFTFNEGAYDGPLRTYRPRGFVRDTATNAVWGMRFIWPIKADYRIVHVSEDYERTIIGRQARDYVWIMARTPHIGQSDYDAMLAIVKREGYDISQVRRVPHGPGEGRDARAK